MVVEGVTGEYSPQKFLLEIMLESLCLTTNGSFELAAIANTSSSSSSSSSFP